jgi:hypothetical protein
VNDNDNYLTDYGLDPAIEVAMWRAGVPLNTRLGQTFARSYEGPSWDAESISEAYSDLASEVGGRASEDGRVTRERQYLASGSTPDTGSPTNATTRRRIVQEELDAMNAGKSREDAMADGFGKLIGHAIDTGDGVINTGI